ncbi:MAG: PEGA domain-containing protein [candidate division Zixibacteria bacterium]|nr:PEGA domain-containing protein [candidate division Zixibacteria bacterium]
MKKLIGYLLLGIIILVGFNCIAYAQQSGSLDIISKPPGAAIVLSGEVDLMAVAPCKISQDIVGSIQVKATRPGYESWRSDLILLPGQTYTLNINLKPRTRTKAAMRSILIPGWGQFYSGNKFRGVMMGLAAVSGATAAVIANDNYSRKNDAFNDAELAFNQAQSIEERERLRDVLAYKQRKAYDAETLKRTYMGIAIGIWAYNFLDAIIFFPDYKQGQLNRSYPTLGTTIIGDVPGIALTAKF